MPFLTRVGVIYVDPVLGERSQVGAYWNAVEAYLNDGSTAELRKFNRRSIFDTLSGKQRRFITDESIIIDYNDQFHFGSAFYKNLAEVESKR